jgi:hypothetical protein
MSDSLERIRHSTSKDEIHTRFMSIMELLKSNDRDDLCSRFTNDLQTIMSGWKIPKVTGDNLNEENMEVDEEQEDRYKKQLSISEYNDVDYRFLDQDMDHRMTTSIIPEHDRRKDVTRKSRFSDVLSSDRDADDRTIKSNLIEEREKRTTMIDNDSDFRTNETKISSPR